MQPFRQLGALCASVAVACSASSSSSGVTLENVCDVLPARYCQQDHPCCDKAGFAFDQGKCEALYRSGCAQGVASVVAHSATFHPSNIDACLKLYQPYEAKCSLDAADFANLAAVPSPCARVFEGRVGVGGACSTDYDCAPPPTGSGAICTAGSCEVQRFAAQGEACGGAVSCSGGLECDNTNHCVVSSGPTYLVFPEGCGATTVDAGKD